ncbi:unnamed protein product [Clonostachys rosea f. rosea IK726]|uniref:Uncharacterized protein n=1 Tax=Clonostachys rosea f. rosea IK726 TaxID=1349383 RepID=A0ACA9TW30_BIOOC|nr:unnamed protein product [Clonostachys rosea f. rosea IK726]
MPTGSSCRECRARKVKCDRTPLRCLVCIRLNLDCSFSQPESPKPGHVEELTQAGTKRKRARRACLDCRAVKAKCSGRRPCERCVAKNLACEAIVTAGVEGAGQDDAASFVSTGLPVASSNLDSMPRGTSTGDPGTTSSTTFEELDRRTIRGYLDDYFEESSRSTVSVLHKATILTDWTRGILDPTLLKIIITTVQYRRQGYAGGTAEVRQSMDHVQQDVLLEWSRYNLTLLQVLVLLAQLRFQAGDNIEVWNLLPIAARMIFTLGLNQEKEHSNAVIQECRRRLVWSIFHLDRKFSGGLEDLAVCSPERIHIRLPCDQHTFQRGAISRAAFLMDGVVEDGTGVDIYAFWLRLLVTRDRVLRYAKRVKRAGIVPSSTYHEMQALQAELDHFEKTLPADLKMSSERTMMMAHSTEWVKYVGLHMQWYQSHCDLYRICVPGLRESLPRDTLTKTPSDFIDFCQEACLRNALRLCHLLSDMYRMEPGDATNDTSLPISIYSAAQICRQLRHLLPSEGENTLRAVKERLVDALQLARPLEIMPGPMKCLRDANKVISALEEGTRGQSSRSSSIGAGEISGHFLPSKHALLPRFAKPDDEHTPSLNDQVSSAAPPSVSGQEEPAARIMLDLASSKQVGNSGQLGEGEVVSWDPFDMEMNDYYDPDIGVLFASLEQQFDDAPRAA